MRIALVITELDPGGAEKCLTELALFLSHHGHETRVWALGCAPQPPHDELAKRLATAGVQVRFGNAKSTFGALRIVRWLRGELIAYAPDVVQSMLWHANVLSALALRRNRCRLLGGMRVSEPRRGRWLLERLAARRMEHIVCVSQDVYQHALKNERLPEQKLLVIPNGVSEQTLTGSTAPNWSDLCNGPMQRVILFVGRLEPQKGVLQLAQQLPALLHALPDWSLAMIGTGSLRDDINKLVTDSDLRSRVHLLGWVPNAANWIRASQIVILPAIYEGMPNVLLEAMAASKPFVAFRVDGVDQLVSPKDGYPSELARLQFAERRNWSEFIGRVQNLASDDHLRAKCGAANHSHVDKHFRLDAQLQKYLRLYEERS